MRPQSLPFLLLFITFIVYLNSFFGAFQFDDYNVIVFNPSVHSFSAWFSDISYGIRLLLKLTYTLNWISGFGIFGFHLFNLAIHLANTTFIYLLSLRLTNKKTAFLASILFAIHPVATEAVTYISGRSTSLMSFFYLGSLLAYINGSERDKKPLFYLISPLLFVMAVSTKETAVTLPLALFLWTRNFKKQAVHWILLLLIIFAIILHPNYGELLEYSFKTRSIKENLLSQINGITYLISRIIFVHRLNIDPDLPTISNWTALLSIQAVLLFVLFIIGLIGFCKRAWFGFGILWFFLHLLPTNSFVPRLDIANERQLYLPIWGIFLALSIGICELQKRIKWCKVLIIALLLILGYFTVMRNYVYRSEIALWTDTASKSPQKARIYNNLGYAYYLAGRFEEAESAYLIALRLKPNYVLARNNLTSLLARKHKK